ncbi:MAG TPA: site-2 protease family protein [Steroidobacteraceae bacterium]|nr:site-2 protease family protein [Steroidobacteraceae bacterium]
MDLGHTLLQVSVWAIPLVLAITLHEVAHGRVALHFGDKTALMLGRLSFNPLKHVDPVGTVLVPVVLLLTHSSFLFGWARPVPVDARNLRHPKTDMALVAAAGPLANVLMACGWAMLFGVTASGRLGQSTAVTWLEAMGQAGVLGNVLLAVFNMLPIPPLDGGRVLVGALPMALARPLARVEPYGLWILIALLFLDTRANVLNAVLLPVGHGLIRLILRLFT